MRAAREESDVVVVSLFVNPTQFASEDSTRTRATPTGPRSPRTPASTVFAPSVEEMYPEGFQTWVEVEEVSRAGGRARPGHFRGVATVCLKLFVVRPDRAYFGQKDAQQAAVVKRSCATSRCRSRCAWSRPCATQTASR